MSNTSDSGVRELPFNAIETQLNFLLGEILTVADAAFQDKEQRKAAKDLIRQRFTARIRWFNELCFSSGEGNQSGDNISYETRVERVPDL